MAGGVKEYMTRGVPTIAPDAELKEAVKRLQTAEAGLIAVCDRGRLVGTLTQHDVANGKSTSFGPRAKVADAVPPDLSYCFEDTDIEEAERLLRESGLDQMVVLDRHGHTVGTLSLSEASHHRVD